MNNLKLKYLEIRNKIELINDNINKQLSTILIDDSALKNKLLFDFENELRVALELEKNKSQDEIQKELNKERISKESQVNKKKLNQYLVAINGFKTNLETKENFINEIDKPEIQNKIGGIKFEINKNKDLINNLTNKLEKELEKEIINNDDTNTLLQETEELKTKIDEVDKIFEKTKEIIEKESIGPVVEEPEISNEELEKARKDLFENKSKILNGFQFNFEKVQTLETFIQKHIYASENTLLDEFKTKLVTNQALKDTFENLKEKLNEFKNYSKDLKESESIIDILKNDADLKDENIIKLSMDKVQESKNSFEKIPKNIYQKQALLETLESELKQLLPGEEIKKPTPLELAISAKILREKEKKNEEKKNDKSEESSDDDDDEDDDEDEEEEEEEEEEVEPKTSKKKSKKERKLLKKLKRMKKLLNEIKKENENIKSSQGECSFKVRPIVPVSKVKLSELKPANKDEALKNKIIYIVRNALKEKSYKKSDDSKVVSEPRLVDDKISKNLKEEITNLKEQIQTYKNLLDEKKITVTPETQKKLEELENKVKTLEKSTNTEPIETSEKIETKKVTIKPGVTQTENEDETDSETDSETETKTDLFKDMMKSNEEKEAKYDEDSLIILQDCQKALNKFAEKDYYDFAYAFNNMGNTLCILKRKEPDTDKNEEEPNKQVGGFSKKELNTKQPIVIIDKNGQPKKVNEFEMTLPKDDTSMFKPLSDNLQRDEEKQEDGEDQVDNKKADKKKAEEDVVEEGEVKKGKGKEEDAVEEEEEDVKKEEEKEKKKEELKEKVIEFIRNKLKENVRKVVKKPEDDSDNDTDEEDTNKEKPTYTKEENQDELKKRIIEMIHNQLFNNVNYKDGETIDDKNLNEDNLKKTNEGEVIDANVDQGFTNNS